MSSVIKSDSEDSEDVGDFVSLDHDVSKPKANDKKITTTVIREEKGDLKKVEIVMTENSDDVSYNFTCDGCKSEMYHASNDETFIRTCDGVNYYLCCKFCCDLCQVTNEVSFDAKTDPYKDFTTHEKTDLMNGISASN